MKFEKPQPNKCKTCDQERHPNRTQCLACITEKARSAQKKQKEKVKKEKIKTKKRLSRSKLIDEADRVFSLFIRDRDKGKPCITCWTPWTDTAQCGHFMSRRHLSTRWDEQNAHGQCPKCNCWGAGEQYAHSKAVDVLYEEGKAEEIQKLANSSVKITDLDILSIIQKFYGFCAERNLYYFPKKYLCKQAK